MPPVDVTWSGDAPNGPYGQAVYVRADWADPWSLVPGLWCEEAVWSTAPALGTATFRWLYGHVKQPAAAAFVAELKKVAWGRLWIKVELTTDVDAVGSGPALRSWHGLVEDIADQMGGADAVDLVLTGEQRLQAFDMKKLLADHTVRTSVVLPPQGPQFEVRRGLTFNRRDSRHDRRRAYGNRSDARLPEDTYAFGEDLFGAVWSTRDIVEYLLHWQTPRNHLGHRWVPFELADADGLPDWDRPTLPADNVSTFALLSQLLDRRRLFTWWVEVDEATGNVQLFTSTFTNVDVPINLTGAAPIPANPKQRNYRTDFDPLTRASLKDAGVAVVDQVITRGAFQVSVGSLSFTDVTLDRAWPGELLDPYNTAASGEPGYAALGTRDKQERNAEVRGHAIYDDVFARFRVPAGWDFEVGDGIGGSKRPMFLDEIEGKDFIYYPELRFEPTLPLLVGLDYSDLATQIATDQASGELMPPLVFFRRPETQAPLERWVRGDLMGTAAGLERLAADANERMSTYVTVGEGSTLEVRVLGQPQHAIAAGDFLPLPVDEDLGGYDFTSGMIVTVAIRSDSRLEARWPPVEPSLYDTLRYKVIDAGDDYRRDYIVPDTVLDVDAAGDLVRSAGGFLPAKGPDDDQKQLEALAQVAAAYYTVRHHIVVVESFRLKAPGEVDLGDLVTVLGHAGGHAHTANSPVTQITLNWPLTSPGGPADPVMTITTWAGELDVQDLRPLVPNTEEDRALGRPREIDRNAPDDTLQQFRDFTSGPLEFRPPQE